MIGELFPQDGKIGRRVKIRRPRLWEAHPSLSIEPGSFAENDHGTY